MRNIRFVFIAPIFFAVLIFVSTRMTLVPATVHGAGADAWLAGNVKSANGEALAGVTVSAKAEGQPITKSVFTDEHGNYYFPAMSAGKYEVWAQAVAFERAQDAITLNAKKRQDFVMKPTKDFERQLTGDQLIAAMPDSTPEDRRLKRVFRNNCTSCHQPNYILQNRFDADGWTAVLDLMKRVDVAGGYQGPQSKPYPIIEHHEKALAAYLVRVRGPGPTAMKYKLRPRPTGDAANVVFTEYDVPFPSDGNSTKERAYVSNNGSNWSLGTPSGLNGNRGIHDVQEDLNGDFWFSYNVPNIDITVGRVNGQTGELKTFKIPGLHGLASFGHGITRDEHGIIWLNITAGVEGGPGRLASIDPNTEKIDVYSPPAGMDSPTPVAGTIDVDGKGKIWATTGPGAVRFDPDTKTFTQFESVTYKKAGGIGPFGGNTYGLAGDADGNGWWDQMAIDMVGKSDIETGRSLEVAMPPVPGEMEMATDEERKLYAESGSSWNSAVPWAQAPRRMGADKKSDVVWVCNWYGGNLAKINTHTMKVTLVPLPDPNSQQPYHAVVDSHHNVWINLMNSDSVLKFDPSISKWTEYPLPTLGAETRYISLLEKNGAIEIVLAYPRTRKVAKMTFRSPQDLR